MKSVALCIKIHIPLIYYKQPFREIKITDKFIDEKQTRNHVENLAEDKLIPFFNSAEKLLGQFGDRLKLSLSISGIAVQLLGKYAPQVLDEIKQLTSKGTIDFLAEPWSNSILPWFLQDELTRQTNLHRRTILVSFGKLPRVFMAGIPINTENFTEIESATKCLTSITYSNHRGNECRQIEPSCNKISHFLINHVLSQKLQHFSSDRFKDVSSDSVAPFLRHIRKYVSLINPLILIFNPLAKNISSFGKWETLISLLLKKTKGSFYSLSDLEEITNYFSIENNYSHDRMEQFKIPDYWLRNNMQKEVFKQLKGIYKTINTTDYPYLPQAWDYLQDLNNLFYMSDSFFLEDFSNQNFSPFYSPHEAFTSYMNAIGNFWISGNNKRSPIIKTSNIISPAIKK